MLLQLKNLLDAGQVTEIAGMMAKAPFVDGAEGARPDIQAVKRNRQVDRAKVEGLDRLDAIVVGALAHHPLVRAAVLPKTILTPLYSRYEPGQEYGFHTDSPLIGQPKQVRTDASVTVFLSDPNSYEGGELVLRLAVGETRIKLAPGDAIVYPTGVLHRVAAIRRGVRLAAVTWMQSLVADAARRELLCDLDAVVRLLNATAPDSEAARLAIKAYGNLFRMWAEV